MVSSLFPATNSTLSLQCTQNKCRTTSLISAGSPDLLDLHNVASVTAERITGTLRSYCSLQLMYDWSVKSPSALAMLRILNYGLQNVFLLMYHQSKQPEISISSSQSLQTRISRADHVLSLLVVAEETSIAAFLLRFLYPFSSDIIEILHTFSIWSSRSSV